jgi:hypothetical protein
VNAPCLRPLLNPPRTSRPACSCGYRRCRLPGATLCSSDRSFAVCRAEFDKLLAVLALPRHPVKAARFEIQRPADPHFARLVPGVRRGLCVFPPSYLAKAYFGIGLKPRLILEKGSCPSRIERTSSSLSRFRWCCSLGSLSRAEPDAASSSAEATKAMECAAKRLSARQDGCSLLEQLHGQKLAAPARAQPSMRGRRLLFDQSLDVFVVGRFVEQRLRAASLTIVKGSLWPSSTKRATSA